MSIMILSILRCGQFISKHISIDDIATQKPLVADSYTCDQSYTIELLSIDPLAIYINDFLRDEEIEHLLNLA
jgi:prolyl 4-hydroxylase